MVPTTLKGSLRRRGPIGTGMITWESMVDCSLYGNRYNIERAYQNLRVTLEDQNRVVWDIRADGAIVMENSILMLMEDKPRDEQTEPDEQEADKFSVHTIRQ